MQTYIFNKTRLCGLMVLCIVFLYACKKDKEGAPVITRLRASSPAPNDSALTVAGPGQTVVIQGANLASTRELYFNGYPTPFNSALFSEENMVVTIPADMPFASLDQTKLNTVRVVTANGEFTYSFPIVPPPPVIVGISHENAAAGTSITISGNNFFFVDKVTFPGNKVVTSGITTNASGTSLIVTVPAGVTGGKLSVSNRYGTGTTQFPFYDFTTGVLCNFDNVNTFSWGSPVESGTTNFPGATGSYAHLKQSNVGANAWDWYNGSRGVITNQVNWVAAANLNDPIDAYVMKFDVYIKQPFTTGCLYIGPMPDDNWQYMYRFEPWKVAAGASTLTNGWRTITIPLNQFKAKDANGTNGAGTGVASLQVLLGNINEVVKMMFVNDTGTPLPELDMAIDNIKVIKLQ
ncbi:MAG: glycan-binding surface protein [Chitinophagaceae bacterium]